MKITIEGEREWEHASPPDSLTLEHDLGTDDDLVTVRVGEFDETRVPRVELIRVLRLLEETP